MLPPAPVTKMVRFSSMPAISFKCRSMGSRPSRSSMLTGRNWLIWTVPEVSWPMLGTVASFRSIAGGG